MRYGYREPEREDAPWKLEGDDEGAATSTVASDAKPSDETDDDEPGIGAEKTDRDADDTGDADFSGIPAGLRKRFTQLNERAKREKEYRELGYTPEEAKSKLSRLAEYEKAEADYLAQQEAERLAATRDSRDEALTDEIIRRLESRRPGLFAEIDASERDRQIYARSHNTAGLEHLRSLYKEEFGSEPSDKTLMRIKDLVGHDINEPGNETMLEAFWDPQLQRKVITQVFNSVKGDLFIPVATALGARDIEKVKQRREANLSRATTSEGPTTRGEGFSSKHEAGTDKWLADLRNWQDRETDRVLASE